MCAIPIRPFDSDTDSDTDSEPAGSVLSGSKDLLMSLEARHAMRADEESGRMGGNYSRPTGAVTHRHERVADGRPPPTLDVKTSKYWVGWAGIPNSELGGWAVGICHLRVKPLE